VTTQVVTDTTTGLIAFLVTTAIAAVCAWPALRAARCNCRQWNDTRGKPIMIAEDSDLIAVVPSSEWPWSGNRWPSPGARGAWNFTALECRAFAHLAQEKAKAATIRDAALNVLAAAVIGWLVTVIAGTFADTPHDKWTTGRTLHLVGLAVTIALVAVIAVASRLEREDYAGLQADYLLAAEAQEQAAPPGTPEAPRDLTEDPHPVPPLPEWRQRTINAVVALLGPRPTRR